MSKPSRFELLPFPPQAPGRNMSAVMSKRAISGNQLHGGTGKPLATYLVPKAEGQLAKFREEHQAAKDVPLEKIAELEVDSREQLILEAAALFADHAVPKVGDQETMQHASLAGCGVVMAFLELSDRFNAEEGMGACDRDYRKYVGAMHKSLVTLLQFAATSHDADGVLMTNICTWTRNEIKRMNDEDLNAGFEFQDGFFKATDTGVVVLKNDLGTRKLASRRGGASLDLSPNKHEILFGCPFRSGIGKLHKAMFEAAVRNNLLEGATNT